MAQLKSTVITGDLSVSDEIVASKLIKAGGDVKELLRANGDASALDWTQDLKDTVLQYVYTKTEVNDRIAPMLQHKGVINAAGNLPTASVDTLGDLYVIGTAGTYSGHVCKVRDVLIGIQSGTNTYSWDRIPAGDDIEDTWRPIKINGTQKLGPGNGDGTGGTIVNYKNGTNISISYASGGNITIAHANPTEDPESALIANANSTTAASWTNAKFVTGVEVSRDAQGHVTGLGVTSNELPTEVVVGDTVTIKYDSSKKALKFVF